MERGATYTAGRGWALDFLPAAAPVVVVVLREDGGVLVPFVGKDGEEDEGMVKGGAEIMEGVCVVVGTVSFRTHFFPEKMDTPFVIVL